MINLNTLLVDFNKIVEIPELPQEQRKKKVTRELSAVDIMSSKSTNGAVVIPWIAENANIFTPVLAEVWGL
jgi:hypothetical protein